MATQIPAVSRVQVRVRDFNRCARCGVPTTTGQWHHRRSRSVIDEHQHCACNGVLLDATCHAWVHQHPFEARRQGWIVSRYAVPHETPMYAPQHGWVLLDCMGGVSPSLDPSEE